MPLPLTFDFVNKIITVPSPDISLEMQYLVNQIRDTEDELAPGMSHSKIADASGKDDLGGGVYTGITVRLLNNWQIRFESRPGPDTIQVSITGGNLVGGVSGNPIASSAYVQVLQVASAAGTIVTPTSSDATNLKYLIGSLMNSHTVMGSVLYWDPYSGLDTNNGLSPTTPVRTFSYAQGLAVDNNNDVIIILPGDPSGITTITETINIIKKGLHLRGPGSEFHIEPNIISADTVTISAANVEVSGMYLKTRQDLGVRNAITINSNNVLIKNCWISGSRQHGISVLNSSGSKISKCVIENCGISGAGDGIRVGNTVDHLSIEKCIISDNPNGISFTGSSITDNLLEDNIIYNQTGAAISIGAGVTRTGIRGTHTFAQNIGGNVVDSGTNTFYESTTTPPTAAQIADTVWDELITDHLAIGTTGRTLKETKTKATLASLK